MTARAELHLCLDDGTGDPALDTAISRAILERVDAGEQPATLRLSRPSRVVAFGRQDLRSPGFPAALEGARARGYDGVARLAGGRAALFHEQTLAFAWAEPHEDPKSGVTERFSAMAEALHSAFQELDVDARIGEVAGEYCAGRWSLNVGGERKVAGIGQRLLPRASHTGGVVVVGDADAVVTVLAPVYDALDLWWRPETTGALDQEVPLSWERVRDAIVDAFERTHRLVPWTLDAPTLAHARGIADEHRLEG